MGTDLCYRETIMHLGKTKTRVFKLLIMGALLFAASSQSGGQRGKYSGLSRSMAQAIRLYEQHSDNAAMDRFMDILMKGTPSEKALANEYISKITLRMNSGGLNYPGQKSKGDSTMRDINKKEKPAESGPVYSRTEEPSNIPLGENIRPSSSYVPKQTRELANIKIKQKIDELRRRILVKLNRNKAVKIYMEKGMPKAISVKSASLFTKGTGFRQRAPRLLADIAGLIFTMGKSHCLILPEGTIEGNIKIMNIRRALALNSYFIERGVSKARLDVNLIGSEVNLPLNLREIRGIVFLFDRDMVPNLVPTKKADKNLPQASMGIFPTVIRTYRNEGAIIEFSVFETPFAEPTWKFQIFQMRNDNTMFLVQEINGIGATYHQSFWNGRKDFFGELYPAGRYLFSLRVVNAAGKEKIVRKLLLVKPKPGAVKTKKVKSKRLYSGKSRLKKRSTRAKTRGGKKYRPKKRNSFRKSSRASAAKPQTPSSRISEKRKADKDAFNGHLTYTVYFKDGARAITGNSEKKLLQIADNMNFYPMSKITITGYAYSGEPNSEATAQNRANFVVSRLSKKYGIEKSRMEVKSKISRIPNSIAEIKMVGGRGE